MSKPVLYLMVGYPGAGKTTVAQLITQRTGAVHLWADWERHQLFDNPNHSESESRKLYDQLNQTAEKLLAEGKSVVFDTNFNYRRDRQLLREVADRQNAETIVVWLITAPEVARERAVHSNVVRNGYDFTMTSVEFDKIVAHLEPPDKNEKIIKIDGVKLDPDEVMRLLST